MVPPLTSFFSNFKSGDSDSGLGEIVAGDTSMTISCSDRVEGMEAALTSPAITVSAAQRFTLTYEVQHNLTIIAGGDRRHRSAAASSPVTPTLPGGGINEDYRGASYVSSAYVQFYTGTALSLSLPLSLPLSLSPSPSLSHVQFYIRTQETTGQQQVPSTSRTDLSYRPLPLALGRKSRHRSLFRQRRRTPS